MIALLMLAAILGGAAAALGAGATEAALRLWRRPARAAWVAALALTALLPAAALVVAPRAAALARTLLAPVAVADARPVPVRVHELPAIIVRAAGTGDLLLGARTALAALEGPLAALWLATSALALLALWRGVRALRRAERAWTRDVVDGVAVAVAPDLGPAVVGVTRPRIVLPAWALALERPLRALVLRHEQEHARAGDPALLMAGALLVAAMPWNPAAWWIARRLRAAIEIDCDARVLQAHPDVTRYGLLLLAVAQRRDASRAMVPALAALSALAPAPTDLERRIATMRARPLGRRVRLARTLGLGVAAGVSTVAALLACAAPDMVASRPAEDAPTPAVARAAPDSLPSARVQEMPRIVSVVEAPRDTAVLRMKVRSAAPPGTPLQPLASNDPMPNGALPRKRIMSDGPEAGAPKIMGPDAVYFEFQVERPVSPASGALGPRYPDAEREARREGEVLAQFVVDTTGQIEVESFKVLQSTGAAFTTAVREALPTFRFLPAEVGGRKVKQLVQQPFVFALAKRQP